MHSIGTTGLVIFGAVVAVPVVIGLLGRWTVRTSDELLLAGRSLPWWLVGSSLAFAGLIPLTCVAGPNEAYHAGLKLLLVPLLLWAALPIVFRYTIPLVYNLELDSIYEYVELRFDPATRYAAAGLFLAGQLLWLGGLLAMAGTVLPIGATTGAKAAMLALLAGIATASACCGGIRAIATSHLVQLGLLVAGLLLVIYVIGGNFPRGTERIWEIAHRMGRARLIEPSLDWSSKWTIWAAAPFCACTAVYFFLADQTTLQRLLAARRQRDMQLGYLIGSAIPGFAVPLAAYVGIGLLALYQDHAQREIPPEWVAHIAVSAAAHQQPSAAPPMCERDDIEQLVAAGLLLDPNTGRPFTDVGQLLGPGDQVLIDRLATRLPPRLGGERLLRRGEDQLLARFIARHLRAGAAGIATAALAGAIVAALSAGLTAMAAVILVDFHRRFGWAEKWLAARQGKPPSQLHQADELPLLRMVLLTSGLAVALLAAAVMAWGRPLSFLWTVLAVTASPLLGVLVLGLFLRRATAPAAMLAMACGGAIALMAAVGDHLRAVPGIGAVWPLPSPLGPFWPFLLGLMGTCTTGWAASFVMGQRKTEAQLAGLVAGLGRLGVLQDLPASAALHQGARVASTGVQQVAAHSQEQVIWLDWPDDESPNVPPPGRQP